MRFIYGAPDPAPASPEVVDRILHPGSGTPGGGQDNGGDNGGGGNNSGGGQGDGGNDEPNPTPTLIGTGQETEVAQCSSGLVGSRSRTRASQSWSDGTITYGEWGNWDESGCRPAAPVVVSTQNQSESAVCDAGFTGQKSRTRVVSTWSNGTTTFGNWSAWNTSACRPNQCVNRYTNRVVSPGTVVRGWNAYSINSNKSCGWVDSRCQADGTFEPRQGGYATSAECQKHL